MNDVYARLGVSGDELVAFCRRRHIRRLALFGSVLRDDFGPDSDVDVLYEFGPGQHPGWHMTEVVEELAALFGRRVDFVPFKGLKNPYLRQSILRRHEVVYAA